MALNIGMIGKTYGPFIKEYNFREAVLIALGCNAGFDGKTDIEYCYEKDLKLLPIYYAVPALDIEVTKTMDWGFNWSGSLHWGFDFKVIKPLDPLKPCKLYTMVTLKGLYDRGWGRGTLAWHYGETFDEEGNLLFTNDSWDCGIYDGGWGGPLAPKDIVDMPDCKPDFEVIEKVSMNTALIHSLLGSSHLLHIDWEYTKRYGYQTPVLQSTAVAGIACRHIISKICSFMPEKLVRFKTRITKSVLLGTTLKTQIWKMDDGSVRFRCVDAEDDSFIYLNYSLAEFK